MKPPEQVKLEYVGQWLDKAESDLAAAELLVSKKSSLCYPACFHSQQAAEKYIKAFLVWHQVEFPKTHVIAELVELIQKVEPALVSKLALANKLTPYGVEVRYPNDVPEPTHQETQEALSLACMVRDAILPLLPLK